MWATTHRVVIASIFSSAPPTCCCLLHLRLIIITLPHCVKDVDTTIRK